MYRKWKYSPARQKVGNWAFPSEPSTNAYVKEPVIMLAEMDCACLPVLFAGSSSIHLSPSRRQHDETARRFTTICNAKLWTNETLLSPWKYGRLTSMHGIRRCGRNPKYEFSSTREVAFQLYYLLSLYHNCDSTTIRLRHDYDEKLTFVFCSWRMEAGARDTS